jgi:hypothetical protein
VIAESLTARQSSTLCISHATRPWWPRTNVSGTRSRKKIQCRPNKTVNNGPIPCGSGSDPLRFAGCNCAPAASSQWALIPRGLGLRSPIAAPGSDFFRRFTERGPLVLLDTQPDANRATIRLPAEFIQGASDAPGRSCPKLCPVVSLCNCGGSGYWGSLRLFSRFPPVHRADPGGSKGSI